MRVLIAISAWPGHFMPMVPLGWALRSAGHDVRVLCSPQEADTVLRTGLHPDPRLLGSPMVWSTRLMNLFSAYHGTWRYPARPLHPDTGEPLDLDTFDMGSWWPAAVDTYGRRWRQDAETAEAYGREWRPDLVVHDPLSAEGPLAAHAAGTLSVVHLWGPTGTEEPLCTTGGFGEGDPSRNSRARDSFGPDSPFGSAEIASVLDRQLTHVLDPCPGEFGLNSVGARLPIRFVPYNGPGTVPEKLPERGGRPRVCVVWGRTTTRGFGPVANKVEQAVTAATELGAEVLLLAAESDVGTAELPGQVHRLSEVPLHLVLPTCDAVIHAAGGGSILTSMVCGVPQLMLTIAENAEKWSAGRLERAGCGLSVRNYEADVPAIKAKLGRLLSEPAFAESARGLAAAAHAMPAPAAVAGQLESLVSTR
ncbi:nucleotide disphospho-sugar-binding domain-containing protein [Amycolatopsis suaedae]|uniref:DUF1205 domain-containing protein n=1 Tax=Amycolatopsis suaedae TaxID=2510978 RepID=A0A4Q7J085_9PSEU|nr:nucleotide disphospho-sugar-binding domain-containing protein [Amycolatopsis suaedae]RZQ60187.1 DUF1205 domain-containing protein [Amycolatopsis suaedae]